jgi:hypothetical protein
MGFDFGRRYLVVRVKDDTLFSAVGYFKIGFA